MDHLQTGKFWDDNAGAWTAMARAGYNIYWLNMLIDAGFVIERLTEPRPDNDVIDRCPDIADATIMSYFLIIRGHKTT